MQVLVRISNVYRDPESGVKGKNNKLTEIFLKVLPERKFLRWKKWGELEAK